MQIKKKIYVKNLLLGLAIVGAVHQTFSLISIFNNDKNIQMIYEVKPGESLYTVANKFNTSTEKLQEINNIENVATIGPGARLKIDK